MADETPQVDAPVTPSAATPTAAAPVADTPAASADAGTNSSSTDSGDGLHSETSRLIAAWEHGGGDSSHLRRDYKSTPEYPGGKSGLTIGMGYDLRYQSEQKLADDWGGVLTPDQLARLRDFTPHAVMVKGKKKIVPGKKPNKAALVATHDIDIRYDDAVKVFEDKILPRYREDAYKAFPGLKEMDPWTQAAVISMTYNRGTSFKGTKARATHFAEIKAAVFKQDTKAIAATLREMKAEHKQKGLKSRRESEAKMIEDHYEQGNQWRIHHDQVVAP